MLSLLCDNYVNNYNVSYTWNGHTYYLGAFDCGAVFTKYINPIGSATTVTINAFSTAGDQLISGGTYAPGVWFNQWGHTNNWGGAIGVGLGSAEQIILNAGQGGVWFNYNGSTVAGVASNGSFSTYSSYTSGYLSHGGGNVPIYATSGGTITTSSSSQRYKQNIQEITDCSWLYNLRPVAFDWKDPERAQNDGRQIGLIAEEVNAQNPQMAWLNTEGQVEGVRYDMLCVPIIVEMQKLKAEVNELKAKLAAA